MISVISSRFSSGSIVVSHCQNIDISGSLAVAEKCAFHALRACKKGQLSSCHAASPVVVRMYAEDNAVSVLEVAAHPLDLVSVDVGRRHLHGGREIEDHGIFRCRLPYVLHSRADLEGKIQLSAGKALGRILKIDLSGELFRSFLDPFGALDGDINDGLLVLAKNHVSLQCRCGVINMHNGLFAALDRFKSLLDLVLSALGQDLHDDIVRDHVLVDQLTKEIVFDLARCRESDLDLLEAELYQQTEHFHFLTDHHGIDQRLISIAKIYAHPCGCLLDLLIRPLSLRIIHDRSSPVSLVATHKRSPF